MVKFNYYDFCAVDGFTARRRITEDLNCHIQRVVGCLDSADTDMFMYEIEHLKCKLDFLYSVGFLSGYDYKAFKRLVTDCRSYKCEV